MSATFICTALCYVAAIKIVKSIENSKEKHMTNTRIVDTDSINAVLQVAFSSKPMGLRATFRSFDSAAVILRAVSMNQSIVSQGNDASLFYTELDKLERALPFLSFDQAQIIVFEGLPLSGKSTVVSKISQECGFNLYTQPILMAHMRDVFHNISEIVGLAFDYISLYVTAMHISNSECKKWLVERYYHYFLAENVSRHSLDEDAIRNLPKGLFEWPKDLPAPNMIGMRVLYHTYCCNTLIFVRDKIVC